MIRKTLSILTLVLSLIASANSSELCAKDDGFDINRKAHAAGRASVVLVLSGGGARGAAQVGVLQELEDAGIVPDLVVGTSIGAIIGGLWCSGYSAVELDTIMRSVDWNEQYVVGDDRNRNGLFLDQKFEQDRSLLTLRFNNFSFVVPQSITSVMRFTAPFQRLFWNAPFHPEPDFNSLKIPFRAVATDLVHAKAVAIADGNLLEAVRASATLPLRYTPVHIDSMVLVDGGLLANIPVEIAHQFKPDIIIAVNTTSPLLPTNALDKPWNVADQVVSVMERQFNLEARNGADVLIEPRIGSHPNNDFMNLDSLAIEGRRSAREIIPTIRTLLSQKSEAFRGELKITSSATSEDASARNVIRSLHVVPEDVFLNSSFSSLVGQTFDYRRMKEQILRRCRLSGLTFASLRVLQFDSTSGRLDIRIDPGTVRHVELIGTSDLSTIFVGRELNVKIGDAPRVNDVIKGIQSIVNTDLFSEVGVDIRHNAQPDSGVTVRVRVVERGSQVVRLGGRVDNERNTQLNIDMVQENILSSGIRLGLRVGGGNRNIVAEGRIEVPKILDSYWTFSVLGYWNSRNQYIYAYSSQSLARFETNQVGDLSEQHLGTRVLFGRQIETSGRIGIELRYEQQRIFQLGDFVSPRAFEPLLTISMSTLFDKQDRADFPTTGRVLSLRLERSFIQAPGANSFSKAEVIVKNTYSTGLHAIQPAFHFAFADATMPSPEFYRMGGAEMFYGMREDEQRGRQIALAQLEYRLKLPIRVGIDTYWSIRYDVGGVWSSMQAIRFVDLRQGIGTALALDTPLGPARISVGRSFYYLRNPNGVKLGPTQVAFSIGMPIQ